MVSQLVVLGWVLVKCCALSAIQVIRALFRFVADPVGESARGWRWLAIKIGISVWLRELFTLAVARDLYAGVPAIYVNYLDYDVFAHAYGPRHRRALRALRRIDRSISRLWRVLRRVPGHRYDLYVLSDHGQVACTPYERFSGGKPIEQALFDDLLDPLAVHAEGRLTGRARRVVHGLAAYRTHRASGLFQRFVNYLERDFPWVLGWIRSVSTTGSASCRPGRTRSSTSWSALHRSASSGSTSAFRGSPTRSRGAAASASCWPGRPTGPSAAGAASATVSTSSGSGRLAVATISRGSSRASAT